MICGFRVESWWTVEKKHFRIIIQILKKAIEPQFCFTIWSYAFVFIMVSFCGFIFMDCMDSVHYTYMQSLVRGEDLPLDTIEFVIIVQRKKHLLLQENNTHWVGWYAHIWSKILAALLTFLFTMYSSKYSAWFEIQNMATGKDRYSTICSKQRQIDQPVKNCYITTS